MRWAKHSWLLFETQKCHPKEKSHVINDSWHMTSVSSPHTVILCKPRTLFLANKTQMLCYHYSLNNEMLFFLWIAKKKKNPKKPSHCWGLRSFSPPFQLLARTSCKNNFVKHWAKRPELPHLTATYSAVLLWAPPSPHSILCPWYLCHCLPFPLSTQWFGRPRGQTLLKNHTYAWCQL